MNINEVKKALEKSTQGIWEQHEGTVKMGEWMVVSTHSVSADAHLIANSPEWLRDLISEVEELQKALKQLLFNAPENDAFDLYSASESESEEWRNAKETAYQALERTETT